LDAHKTEMTVPGGHGCDLLVDAGGDMTLVTRKDKKFKDK
jgi:hypothetical protein